MTACRRLMKELEEICKCGMKNFRNIQVDEANLLTRQGLIVPDSPPYDKRAFRIEINFPAEPGIESHVGLLVHGACLSLCLCLCLCLSLSLSLCVTIIKKKKKKKIYHPNIDEKGQALIQSLIALVNDPQPEHPLRADLAEEYSKDRKKFCKNAEEFTKKYGEKRPVD
ncbi:unnamed protein product [Nyctereutes procyonoides]|uniref:(raccoon dog) hypothetical protein n=1 Tax=Nyctereutes procyonoides TaxID=34880 RepID=A0A811ZE90_NYCPR|nr:unnamed protein product [Nyctereutes procyonoides]